jgi:hypothetical protein
MTMASGLYIPTWRDALGNAIALDLDLDTHKVILVDDDYTPNFDTHNDIADIPASPNGELPTAGGYTVGGKILTGLVPTWGLGNAGQLKYDLTTDQSWSSATFVARGAVWYADALATNDLIFAHTFGADFTVSNGVFTIQLPAGGAFTIDLVP